MTVDGQYFVAIVPVTGSPSGNGFKLEWSDAAGHTFKTGERSFSGPIDKSGAGERLTQATAGSGVIVQLDVNVPSTISSRVELFTVKWRLAGTGGRFSSNGVEGNGNYSLLLGDSTQPLTVGSTYEICVQGVTPDGDEILVDHFNYTVGAAADPAVVRSSLAWKLPSVGSSQLFVIDGVLASVERIADGNGGTDGLAHIDSGTNSSGAYAIFYTDKATESHTISQNSTDWNEPVYALDQNGIPYIDHYEFSGYDLDYRVNLSPAEAARVVGGLKFAWKDQSSGVTFVNQLDMTDLGGGAFQAMLPQVPLATSGLDVKVWYTDAAGHEVIVDWKRFGTSSDASSSGYSETVFASEQGGTYTGGGGVAYNVTPGVYVGALSSTDFLNSMLLPVVSTGLAAVEAAASPEGLGYYSETRFNALDAKIATNENDGVWREFGVDLHGDAVETRTYGVEGKTQFLSSLADYDQKGNKIAQFDAAFVPDGESVARRPVTRYGYDAYGHQISEINPFGDGRSLSYNALGLQTGVTDFQGGVQHTSYNAEGQVVSQTDELGRTHYKKYDAAGNLTAEIDATGRTTLSYDNDSFGRAVGITDGAGNRIDLQWDKLDRLIRRADKLYFYDKRGNEVLSYDVGNANGHRIETTYDALGRVASVTRYGRVGDTENVAMTEKRAYDAFGNLVAETGADGKTKQHVFGKFGRLQRDIDEAGKVLQYQYDDFGRQILELGSGVQGTQGQRNVSRQYDDGGRLVKVTDNSTGSMTTYTYDIGGRRSSENQTATSTGNGVTETRLHTLRYAYNKNGWMTGWTDANLGLSETIDYDAAGYRSHVTGTGTDHQYEYDAAGRLLRVRNGVGGPVVTEYTYDAGGNRKTLTSGGQTVVYDYDNKAQVIKATIAQPSTSHGVDTSLASYTVYDLVFDPQTQQYDKVARVIWYSAETMLRRLALAEYFDPNRWTEIAAQNGINGADSAQTLVGRTITVSHVENYYWTYDGEGNITRYEERLDDNLTKQVDKTFDQSSRSWYNRTLDYSWELKNTTGVAVIDQENQGYPIRTVEITVSGQETTQQLDAKGLITKTTMRTLEGNRKSFGVTEVPEAPVSFSGTAGLPAAGTKKTFYYIHDYTADGREKQIRAYGDASGNSSYEYDANGQLVFMNQGQGDGQSRPETSRYIYNTDGRIVYKSHDDGKSGTNEQVDYEYASNNPVAEKGIRNDGGHYTLMDSGRYALFQDFSKDYPDGVSRFHTVQTGQSLQALADLYYGNASLWYLIADANGLTGSEALKAGTVIKVPTQIQSGAQTYEAHSVYNESDIIGSKLPNLKSPPPPKKKSGCASFLIIIIAIVVTVFTAGAAAAFIAPAMTAGMSVMGAGMAALAGSLGTGLAGLAVSVAAATVGAAVGSIVSQGVAVAVGLQDKINWRAVGTSALSAGITAGVGALLNTATAVKAIQSMSGGHAVVEAAVRSVAASVLTQGISVAIGLQDKFSWTDVAAAGVTAAASNALFSSGSRALTSSVDKVASPAIPMEFSVLDAAKGLGQNFIVNTAGSALRSVFAGEKPQWSDIATSSLANAIGDTITGSLAGYYDRPVAVPQATRRGAATGNSVAADELSATPDQIGEGTASGSGLTPAQKRAMEQGYGPLTPEAADAVFATADADRTELGVVSVAEESPVQSGSSSNAVEPVKPRELLGRVTQLQKEGLSKADAAAQTNAEFGGNYLQVITVSGGQTNLGIAAETSGKANQFAVYGTNFALNGGQTLKDTQLIAGQDMMALTSEGAALLAGDDALFAQQDKNGRGLTSGEGKVRAAAAAAVAAQAQAVQRVQQEQQRVENANAQATAQSTQAAPASAANSAPAPVAKSEPSSVVDRVGS